MELVDNTILAYKSGPFFLSKKKNAPDSSLANWLLASLSLQWPKRNGQRYYLQDGEHVEGEDYLQNCRLTLELISVCVYEKYGM